MAIRKPILYKEYLCSCMDENNLRLTHFSVLLGINTNTNLGLSIIKFRCYVFCPWQELTQGILCRHKNSVDCSDKDFQKLIQKLIHQILKDTETSTSFPDSQ